MAAGPVTKIADIIVPEIFTPYAQQRTQDKSALIKSGALVVDPALTALLASGGLTFNSPSYNPLDDDQENTSTDDQSDSFSGGANDSTPMKIQTAQEIQVRLSRNQSWGTADLASTLSGSEPMEAIANLVGDYWAGRLQSNFIASVNGVYADNAAAPDAAEHVQDDMTNDISAAAYQAGVTDFSAPAFIDTLLTMSDSMNDLGLMCVSPVVMAQMIKLKIIDYKNDTDGVTRIPVCFDHVVIMDKNLPSAGGVYETWVFGGGAMRLGVGSPDVPTETDRLPAAGKGGGNEVLHNRVEWCIHPSGHAYSGTSPNGGPSSAATANNLGHADSWKRVFTDRRAIKMARLITREH